MSPADTKRFVLVHGAWHGAWCWRDLENELRGLGHETCAIDLPGNGSDRTPATEVSLALYGQRVCEALDASRSPSVLVGHSLGGLSISLAAELRPNAISSLVYLAALVPQGGQAGLDVAIGSDVTAHIEPDASGSATTVRGEALEDLFYADCTEEQIAFARRSLCPQPMGVVLEQLQLSKERFGAVRKVYIECLQDHAISIESQRALQGQQDFAAILTMNSSHSPFFSQAPELAHLLTSGV